MTSIVIGAAEVSLPRYMRCLHQSEIDACIHREDSHDLIAACGIDPKDGCLYLVTMTCDIRKLSPNGRLRPSSARPINSEIIEVAFGNVSRIIFSSLAIKNSEECLNNSSLHVNNNYMCDIELSGFEIAQRKDEDQTSRS